MNPTGMFLDITQTHDVLNHTIFLPQLNCVRIRSVASSWFESYLSHWRQCVEINDIKTVTNISTKRKLEHGALQLSVLGPVLFLLYINDLPLKIMVSKIVLCVDDKHTKATRNEANPEIFFPLTAAFSHVSC